MTIQECYAALGGDYQEVLGRLYSESLVQRFVGKFLSDPSFQLLEDSLKAENYDEAFRAAQPRAHRGPPDQGLCPGSPAVPHRGGRLRTDRRRHPHLSRGITPWI